MSSFSVPDNFAKRFGKAGRGVRMDLGGEGSFYDILRDVRDVLG